MSEVTFDDPLPRETGEQRSGQFCAECETELPLVSTPYRSTHVGACPACSAKEEGGQLQAQIAAATGDLPPAEEPQKPGKSTR